MISLSAFHILYRLLTTYVKYDVKYEIRYALRSSSPPSLPGPYLTKYYGLRVFFDVLETLIARTFVFLKRDAESPHVS